MSARQRLEEMMMCIDEAWNDHVPSRVEYLVASRRGAILFDQFDDLAIFDDKTSLASC
jgi:hypothetical protein